MPRGTSRRRNPLRISAAANRIATEGSLSLHVCDDYALRRISRPEDAYSRSRRINRKPTCA